MSTVVAAAKAAKAAQSSAQDSLFAGFLALAGTGADGIVVRATGAAIRESIRRVMRVAAGYTPVKAKGSKESGAPDFSTASVYAGVVADVMGAYRDNVTLARQAFDDVQDATETPPALSETPGFFAGVSANKRFLLRFAELVTLDLAHSVPALFPETTVTDLAAVIATMQAATKLDQDELAILRREMANAKALIETLRDELATATAKPVKVKG